MSILFDWRIQDIERKADRAEQRLYELDELNRRLASLEYSFREISSDCDGLRYELQTKADQIIELEDRIIELENLKVEE